MSDSARYNRLWAELLVEELVRNGVTTFCLSPGSRCAPLTMAAASNPRARSIVHFDERGAAYFAQGYARATGAPAALVCTSGTAAANYLPAVVEASEAHVPMVVLTADRPSELLDCASNQTMDQVRLFGRYVRWEFDLPAPDAAAPVETVLTTVDQAVYRATRSPAGPVHLNCPYREPLTSPDAVGPSSCWDQSELDLGPTSVSDAAQGGLPVPPSVESWRRASAPYTRYEAPDSAPSADQEQRVRASLERASRGLLIVGELRTEAQREAARAFVETLGWPAFADVTSGLRLGVSDAAFIGFYDQLLLSERFRTFCRPDVVLHLGGRFTSKRLLEQLVACPPETYILVADHPLRQDPGHRVTQRIEADVTAFCNRLVPRIARKSESDWVSSFRYCSRRVDAAVDAFFEPVSLLSEPALARAVSRHAPEGSGLFLGNSMPIRDMDMYGAAGARRLRVAANRGASGIDGAVASSAGFAHGLQRPVTAILGDLAFLHDLNSLALMQKAGAPVVLIVLNNNGGGIFHFLPVAAFDDVFEPYFATPHGLSFERAAAMFGLSYARPATMADFLGAYQSALERGGSSLIEAVVDRHENLKLHRALQESILAAIGRGE